jgi:hypothetical protein
MRRRVMRLSVPVLAAAVREYLGQQQEFDDFVVDHLKMNEAGGLQV